MDFIMMNEQINKFSRTILHSEDSNEKIIFKNYLKEKKVEIKNARKRWDEEHLMQIMKSNVA